ncbi:hypothetical protein NUW54_g10690 [Trametes sanguinea]|uniref:Uncharacterized protein n=1 Tax=Trametes sanguinea TaxID=158606 RepID=A0ACC1NWP8_9APHY|nr:hypothetical protein NUW54_g10690 [Trametes sanguinea]
MQWQSSPAHRISFVAVVCVCGCLRRSGNEIDGTRAWGLREKLDDGSSGGSRRESISMDMGKELYSSQSLKACQQWAGGDFTWLHIAACYKYGVAGYLVVGARFIGGGRVRRPTNSSLSPTLNLLQPTAFMTHTHSSMLHQPVYHLSLFSAAGASDAMVFRPRTDRCPSVLRLRSMQEALVSSSLKPRGNINADVDATTLRVLGYSFFGLGIRLVPPTRYG